MVFLQFKHCESKTKVKSKTFVFRNSWKPCTNTATNLPLWLSFLQKTDYCIIDFPRYRR